MGEKIDLRKIEKNILKMGHQHGFFDLLIGFMVMGMGFSPFFREGLPSPYKYFLWPLILIIISYVLTFFILKYVIQPRTGVAKPGPSIKSMRRKLVIATSIQVVIHLTFVILLVIGIGSGIHIEGFMFMLIIGLFFLPIFAIIGYLMKYPRLYLIAILIWLAIFINELFYDPIDYRIRWLISYGIMGGLIFTTGLAIFIRFLKKYPLPKKELD